METTGITMAGAQVAAAGAVRPYAGSGISLWLTTIPSQKPRTCRFDVMNHRARRLQESSQ